MNPELEELYQEVILDHSRHPRNFGRLADVAVRVHGDNPACGDEIDLDLKFGADGSLQDIKFSGHGCAISQASASMMTAKLKGKTRAAAMEMLRAFRDLVAGESDDPLSIAGRPANDARRPKISAARQMRDAGVAGAGRSAAPKRGRSHGFDRRRLR